MRRPPSRTPTPLVLHFALILVLSLLVPSAEDRVEFDGAGIERYFSEFAASWSTADPQSIVRFYDVDVRLPDSHTDAELNNPAAFWYAAEEGAGQIWLANRIAHVVKPHQRTIEGVFLDERGAFVSMSIADLGASIGLLLDAGSNGITRQIELRWRDAHQPTGAPDVRLAWTDELISRYLKQWSSPDATASLYRADAFVTTFGGTQLPAYDHRLRMTSASLDTLGTGAATFYAPGVQLANRGTDIVAFVMRGEDVEGCPVRQAVVVDVADDRIATERRMLDVDSITRCGLGVGYGWWTRIAPPSPLEDRRTGTVQSAAETPVVNGSPELEALFEWTMSRFDAAGIGRPTVASVAFGALASCGTLAGVIVDSGSGDPGIVSCTDGPTVCRPSVENCQTFSKAARFGMLHEVAHVWLVEHLEASTEAKFMDLTGASVWVDGSVPWDRRGAEQAAEVMAWGLMDEPLDLVRIGDPPCPLRQAGFRMLTAAGPLTPCPG